MRKIQFVIGKYYHIFNRGTDKRIIFSEQQDLERFFQGMEEFNDVEPIGSIYENSFRKDEVGGQTLKKKKLVSIVCYCLNPNHYHFILKQLTDEGISKFMHRMGTGYPKYFNEKYKRSGSLFQGPFKAIHIESNKYLLHLSAYVNLNNKIHQIPSLGSRAPKSSWNEYINEGGGGDFCRKSIILEQFKNVSDYKNFAEESLENIKERKDMENLFLED